MISKLAWSGDHLPLMLTFPSSQALDLLSCVSVDERNIQQVGDNSR
jgi:hypothetical protein